MKTIQTTLKGLLPILALSFLFISCSKDDNDGMNENEVHYATLGDANGAQVEPPVSTPGTASMAGTYNTGTNKWEYSVSWSNLSSNAIAIEIHGPGTEGPNTTRVFTEAIESGGPNGAKSVSVTLTEAQEDELTVSAYSFVVTTTNHPNGEVRGLVTAITR